MKTGKKILSLMLVLTLALSFVVIPTHAAEQAATSTVLFEDDFSGDLSKWTAINNAQIVDGRLQVNTNGFALFASTWSDYVLEFDAELCGPYRGISFRRQEATGDDCFWWLSSDGLHMVKRIGGVWQEPYMGPSHAPVDLNGQHHYKLILSGSTVKAYVDGLLYNMADVGDFLTGGFLFFAATDGAYFDNVKVTPYTEDEILLQDDFTNGSNCTYASNAQIVDGRIQVNANGFVQYAADWTDYTLEFDAELCGAYRGISFRRQEATGDDYFWWLSGDGLHMIKRVGGEWTQPYLGESHAPMDLNGKHHYKLEVSGSTFKGYVDGVLVNEAHDEAFTSGGVLLFAATDGAYFDNVMVTAKKAPAVAPEGALFYDDFSGDLSKWTGELADITDAEKLYIPVNGWVSPIGDDAWTNYTVEFDADYNGQPYRGVAFRQNGGSDYLWWFGGEGSEIAKRINGGWERVGQASGMGIAAGTHHFKLEVNGNTFNAYVDGNLYTSVTDDTLTSGGIAFNVAYDNAWYDNVVVMPIVEEACQHENQTTTTVDATCGAEGSVTVTCDDCGEVISTETIPATGNHDYPAVSAANAGAACSVCGKEVFAWAGMSVSLESSLQATFVVQTANLPESGYYAVIEKEVYDKATGEISIETTRFEAADFANYNDAGTMKKIVFSGVAAKQMTDRFTVTIYNANGEQISASYTRTIEEYILSLFGNAKTSEAMKVVAVDFLNYGAAAQDKFGYRTTELANRGLTDELKALATADEAVADVTDDRTKDDMLAGTAVAAEYEIIPAFVYQTSKLANVVKAEVSYVNFKGETVSYEVAAADFANYNDAGTMKKIEIKGTAVADGASPITVKLIDADGNVLDESIECVNFYCARMAADHAVFTQLLKVIYSAKVAFA